MLRFGYLKLNKQETKRVKQKLKIKNPKQNLIKKGKFKMSEKLQNSQLGYVENDKTININVITNMSVTEVVKDIRRCYVAWDLKEYSV